MIPLPQAMITPEQNSTETHVDLFYEVKDRMNRAKNIIIQGAQGIRGTDVTTRSINDIQEVKKFLQSINKDCPKPIKIVRLEKYDTVTKIPFNESYDFLSRNR
ncbi:hypothetical protein EVAR_82262_1 [Eumeta japonica]|uniref:Uncharacterized protein n=1 Tax=Eumeta variegata TaxID=151549 RepID=A0A4C1VZ13_EUMVA|nr:hypothetical protein EVAR_82262_1 [Eumeta japonica]